MRQNSKVFQWKTCNPEGLFYEKNSGHAEVLYANKKELQI